MFSDGKLQAMSDIVKNMNTSRLCDYDCKPEVTVVNGTNLTVSFTTINAITDDVNTSKFSDNVKRINLKNFAKFSRPMQMHVGLYARRGWRC